MKPTIQDAIFVAYPNAINIIGGDINTLKVYDANENEITIDASIVEIELQKLKSAYNLDQVKIQAENLLKSTDWATLSDVTTGNPKLINQADFLSYRNFVRAIAVNPTENPNFPNAPIAVWG